MSLTAGRGPHGRRPAGRFSPALPGEFTYVEPHPRRIQARIEGICVLDTERALLIHRPGRFVAYLFPLDEVAALPHEPASEAPGYAEVPWEAADLWFEEGRLLVDHPADPYHRVDCRPTARHLRVSQGELVLVDTTRTVIVFETALPARLYASPDDVRAELLTPSVTRTYCNYKGWASYWDVTSPTGVIADAVWSYEQPLPEAVGITGLLGFDPDKLQVRAELPGDNAFRERTAQR